MYSRKSVGLGKYGALRNSSILTGYSCEDFPKSSITEKRRSKAKYLT